ncbi:unnamed protein product [Soboliphyme baturini]|uniref:Superoxide dismutase n=1 Tax=Soboliphyme baturini TaxID=241478 RepID=A0A183J856_9BILA|nr:unnamed protein product [Soboliphyme baturini]
MCPPLGMFSNPHQPEQYDYKTIIWSESIINNQGILGHGNQKATVSLVSSDRSVQGLLTLTEVNNRVQLTGSIGGVSPGLYSFQVYEKGDVSSPCNSVGLPIDFFRPQQGSASIASPTSSHFESFRVDSLSSTTVNINSLRVSLNGPNSIVGRSLVLIRQDANGIVGTYGTKVACGVIGIV